MRSLSTRAAGLLILALGIWGGLVPFVGHYFHFALGPDQAWHWSRDRLFLSVLPGVTAALGGLMLIGSGPRRSARLGALLAVVAGIWFAIGPDVSHLWNAAGAVGHTHGSKLVGVLELVTYHSGLGAVIAALGGYALPRFVAPAVTGESPEPAVRPGAGRETPSMATERTSAGGGAAAAAHPTSDVDHEGLDDEPARQRGTEDRTAALGTAAAAAGVGRRGPEPGARVPADEAEQSTYVVEPARPVRDTGDAPAGTGSPAEPNAGPPVAAPERPAVAPERPAVPATAEGNTTADPVASQTTPGPAASGPEAPPSTRVGRRRTGGLLSRLTGR